MEHPSERQRLAERLARELPTQVPASSRRRFIQQASMLLLASSLAPATLFAQSAAARPKPRFTSNPFTLGVASGYPRLDTVVLWTRLACEPLNGGGIPEARHQVQVEVATDRLFSKLVHMATVPVYADLGHSVHVEPRGLQPATEYFYRFHCGDWTSPVGRTRTAPALDARPERIKLALASCQNFEQGYFGAYRQMVDDEPDLIVFVGDYIYENAWGQTLVRRHHGDEPTDLRGYRNRHAQYKLDSDLQAAHAAVPWILTWDDHEVDNDYAGAQTESLDPAFLLRRAAAYQAYYEHLPLPRSMLPSGPDMRIYTHLDYGDLARIAVLDNRQYRSPQACQPDNKGGSSTVLISECAELAAPQRTLLGEAQEQWLDARLKDSPAKWNVLAQQTIFAHQVQGQVGADAVWTDAWDGYPAARERLLAMLERHQTSNPLLLGGDVHAFYANDIHRDGGDPQSERIALEICTSSLSADGLDQALHDQWRSRNPHIHLSRSDVRGYALLTLGREQVRADLRTVDDVRALQPQFSTLHSFQSDSAKRGWSG